MVLGLFISWIPGFWMVLIFGLGVEGVGCRCVYLLAWPAHIDL